MPSTKIHDLLDIMQKLRDPETGCPWDKEQSFVTIAPYTIEEAYEVAETINDEDYPALKEELGDLLFQVVFHSELAREKGLFDFEDVLTAISDKMVRRHPHVFGVENIENAEAQAHAWEAQKEQERMSKAKEKGRHISILDDVPLSLPSLLRALKLQKRAARVGFDWPDTSHVIDKIKEEIIELSEAIEVNGKKGHLNQNHIEEELGDLLFVCANLARHLDIDPENALRMANGKFIKRFKYVEQKSINGDETIKNKSLDQMEALWVEAKGLEKKVK